MLFADCKDKTGSYCLERGGTCWQISWIFGHRSHAQLNSGRDALHASQRCRALVCLVEPETHAMRLPCTVPPTWLNSPSPSRAGVGIVRWRNQANARFVPATNRLNRCVPAKKRQARDCARVLLALIGPSGNALPCSFTRKVQTFLPGFRISPPFMIDSSHLDNARPDYEL
jgi:hypothetical protein